MTNLELFLMLEMSNLREGVFILFVEHFFPQKIRKHVQINYFVTKATILEV